MKENAIKAVLAAALGALASYGTQLIVPAIILVAVMVLDYICLLYTSGSCWVC